MITEYQYYQVLTERDEARSKVEELTKLVASLEKVRAKEYAFKQAKVEELTAENELSVLAMTRACECVKTLEAKVDALETENIRLLNITFAPLQKTKGT